MNRVRFHELVLEDTALFRSSPVRFQRRVRWLVGGALAYLAGVVLVLGGVLAWCGAAIASGRAGSELTWPVIIAGLGILGVLRGLFVRLDPPGGRALARGDAPGLFAMVDALRTEMGGAKITGIWVDGRFNAVAYQRPIFGLFGFARHHLTLGLPLLAALPPAGLRAILAHELAHFERDHGRFGRWLYRFQHSWNRLSESGLAAVLLLPFASLFGHRFSAATSVHARGQEFEADARAAECVGAEAFGGALVRIHVVGARFESEFPSELERATAAEPSPSSDAMSRSVAFVRAVDADDARGRRLLISAYGQATNWEDSHPSLFERLRQLRLVAEDASHADGLERAAGLAARMTGPDSLTELFADPAVFLRIGDAEWEKEASTGWEANRERVLAARARLSELRLRPERGEPLVVEEQWECVQLVGQLEGNGAARAALERFVEAHPAHSDACMQLASLLYDAGDAECLRFAERAAEADPVHRAGYTALRQQWWRENGEASRAEAIQTHLLEQSDTLDVVAAERSAVPTRARFAPHELPGTVAARVAEQLSDAGGIARAYLVRREVKHLPERPQFIIAVEVERRSWWKFQSANHEAGVLQRVLERLSFPHDWVMVLVSQLAFTARRRLRRTPGALVYAGRRSG